MRIGFKGALLASGLLVALGCGSDNSKPSGPTISIQNLTFSPADMSVAAGTTITIVNNDSMAHTVTSEAADNDFTPGAVAGVSFDSGLIAPGGGGNPSPPPNPGPYVEAATASITIPTSAPSGTVIPYFCQNHKGAMATPNGHITVR
jgi:plastocyanin